MPDEEVRVSMTMNNGKDMTKTILPQPSKRGEVAPFLAMDVFAAAVRREKEGHSVVHMEVGQPGAPAPMVVRQAAKEALDIGKIGYTEALGMRSLRERIARHYHDSYGVRISADRVAVTTGSSAGFILSFLSMFEVGDRVAIASPGYPAYRNTLTALGLEPVTIETSAATGWVVTGEAVAKAHAETPLKGVLVMSPANPSGTMMSPEAIRELADTCRRLGIWLISDEIYHGLTYDKPAQTALAFDDNAVIVNSFSKYYCMTGWRVGWLILPPSLVRPVERLSQSLYISAPQLSQIAAEAAFEAVEELEVIKAGYARNRQLFMKELPALGFGDMLPVDGAFYAYIDIGQFTNDSMAFCRRLLDEAGIAATPGLDFDPDRGNRFMRLSFAGTYEDCESAIERLAAFRR
jgi:aspartate/methionine/tyrosine aminotransferase